MTIDIPYHYKSIGWDKFVKDCTPPPHFSTTTGRLSEDGVTAQQEKRFIARIINGWLVPFSQRLWGKAGLEKDDRRTGYFICVAYHVGDGIGRREDMTVRIERKSTDVDAVALKETMRQSLFKDLGVKVDVEIVEAGSLAGHTRLGRDKVRRLLDLRKPRTAAPRRIGWNVCKARSP